MLAPLAVDIAVIISCLIHILTVTSSSTTFPVQNNINLVAKILLDFLWWFTVMALDSR